MDNKEEVSVEETTANDTTQATDQETTNSTENTSQEASSVDTSEETTANATDQSTETTTLTEAAAPVSSMSVPFIGLSVIQFVVAILLIGVVLQQSKTASGMSSTIIGGDNNSYWNKNKGRSKESKQAKLTVILAVIFFIITVALGIIK